MKKLIIITLIFVSCKEKEKQSNDKITESSQKIEQKTKLTGVIYADDFFCDSCFLIKNITKCVPDSNYLLNTMNKIETIDNYEFMGTPVISNYDINIEKHYDTVYPQSYFISFTKNNIFIGTMNTLCESKELQINYFQSFDLNQDSGFIIFYDNFVFFMEFSLYDNSFHDIDYIALLDNQLNLKQIVFIAYSNIIKITEIQVNGYIEKNLSSDMEMQSANNLDYYHSIQGVLDKILELINDVEKVKKFLKVKNSKEDNFPKYILGSVPN